MKKAGGVEVVELDAKEKDKPLHKWVQGEFKAPSEKVEMQYRRADGGAGKSSMDRGI